uniref:transcription factor 21 n=1 Tax=Semicossyphus pulcher TaxID=241346 RepID=UPI0037E8023D
MSTGSLSDVDDELLDGILKFGSSGKDSNDSTEESSNCEGTCTNDAPGKKKKKKASRKTASKGVAPQEGKHVQRNAANARERARMRVLSKAFSRLKTSLPWVPPDTKLSKLDTLRLASSYIAHLRQILANDKYENGFIHPVNLTWPFMVAGKPETDLKEMLNTTRLCGTTAS